VSVDLVTFGCRLNAYESEVIRAHAQAAGLADTIVVNTCAVTAEATRQARQAIRRLRRERPDARIVVTGCAAQVEPELFGAMPEVDRVLGNREKLDPDAWRDTRALFERAASSPSPRLRGEGRGEGAFPHAQTRGEAPSPVAQLRADLSPQAGRGGVRGDVVRPFQLPADSARVAVNDIMTVTETAAHLIDGFEGRARAFVQVQNGCDHRCTFCIIPFGRGPSRSVPMGEVVAQVRRLCARGYREVVLTGVDLTSYGAGLPGAPKLGTLVRQILKHVGELERLRLSSIDAVEVDGALLDALASEARLMPHLHLSLQAGDDLILKRMKRRHLRGDAIALCGQIRRLRPDIVFGADLIAGFPTETEAMFTRSLDLIDECGLTYLHVFPFSPRASTPAARMPPVAPAIVKERAARLRQKGEAALCRHLDREIGARRRVLAETPVLGRTEQFAEVRLARGGRPGAIIEVEITGHDGRRLLAAPA
jgi:threonylcarbamoyladenosine tRNA methylthiotransferase MtaB